MHPINNHNFGTHGIGVSFWNGSSVVLGYITKQTGTSRFAVSDGTTTKNVSLAPTTTAATNLNLAANQNFCTIAISGAIPSAKNATFTPAYTVDTTTTMASSGTGGTYAAADILNITGGAGAQITVNTVTSGKIATFTVTNAGTGLAALLTNPVATTKASGTGTGTGATFNLKYKLATLTSSGGTGYAVNDAVLFNGMVAAVYPTAHISASTGGAATTTILDTNGSGITTAATSFTAGGAAEHVKRIWSTKAVTTEGNSYFWALNAPRGGSSVITSH